MGGYIFVRMITQVFLDIVGGAKGKDLRRPRFPCEVESYRNTAALNYTRASNSNYWRFRANTSMPTFVTGT